MTRENIPEECRIQTRLDGRVALVTGAGGEPQGWSVGKAIAMCLAQSGAQVGILDVNRGAAEVTHQLIGSAGQRSAVLLADVRVPDQVRAAIEQCVETFGRLDILVNNVAIAAVGSVVDTPPEEWERVLNVNLTAAYLACKYAVPFLAASGHGRVVNISSLAAWGYTGTALAAYAASKAGMHGLSRDVALRFAAQGVCSNTVVVGLIDTPMVRRYAAQFPGEAGVEAIMRARDARVPRGKQGTAWDVAHLVQFLASDLAQFINGAEIVVDGGSSARIA